MKRVYLAIAGVLALLWCGMFVWAFQALKPGVLNMVSAPPPPSFSQHLRDFVPLLHIPGVRFSIYHTVPGDTFASVALKFDVLETTLRSLNQANDYSQPASGTPLLIPTRDGIFYMVRAGQGLSDISRAFGVPLGALLKANHIRGDSDISPGEILYLPGADYLIRSSERWQALLSLAVQKGFIKPTTGRLSDGFGERINPISHRMEFHEGLDLAPGWGKRVVAAQTGRVVFAGIRGGYGRLIILDHGKGLTTRYGHLDEILVKVGQRVERGQLIGRVGDTGYATGPHLHFEVRLKGKPQNPLLYLVP